MYLRHLFLIALYLVSISYSLAAEPTPVQLDSFQCTGTPLSIKLPAGLTQLQKMAPLQKQEVIRTEQWDAYQTIEIDLHFVGLTIGAITFTNDHERHNLVSARVSRAAWAVSPFRIGMRAEPALRGLGVKGDVSNGTWRIEGLTDALVVEVRAGRISGVVYDCYTG